MPDETHATEPLDTDLELAKSIRRYIRDRLADPDLGPDLICRDFAVSRTRLYRLMRESGNVATTIRRLRLARAYGEIAAGRYAGTAPAAIAARSGFRQERSFRRAFIEEFAVSPTALQAQVGAGSLPPLPASGPVIAEWFSEL